jgi:hypothetical protein
MAVGVDSRTLHMSRVLDAPREHETIVTLECRAVGRRTGMILVHGPFLDETAAGPARSASPNVCWQVPDQRRRSWIP